MLMYIVRNSFFRNTIQWVFILSILPCYILDAVAADGVPNFSGVWAMKGSATATWPSNPPWTAEGKAAQAAWAIAPEKDPAQLCIFHLGRIVSAPLPHEFIQQDGRITILYEYQHQVRRVYLDGRDHPKDEYPTLMGHSVGWWEGDTLIVDTTGVDAGYLRPQGLPYTDSAHFIERYTLLDDGKLKKLVISIDDPAYYREPWDVTLIWSRADYDIRDYDCIVRPHVKGVK
jgi:hypothetical protein